MDASSLSGTRDMGALKGKDQQRRGSAEGRGREQDSSRGTGIELRGSQGVVDRRTALPRGCRGWRGHLSRLESGVWEKEPPSLGSGHRPHQACRHSVPLRHLAGVGDRDSGSGRFMEENAAARNKSTNSLSPPHLDVSVKGERHFLWNQHPQGASPL